MDEEPSIPLITSVKLSGRGCAVEVEANESLEDTMRIAAAQWSEMIPKQGEPVGFAAENGAHVEHRLAPDFTGQGSRRSLPDVEA